MQQHRRDCPEEMGLRAEHSVAPRLFLRNHRENILGYSSVLSHCIFALTESISLPSFLFYLPWLFFKSVIGSMERVTETPAMKGSFGVLLTSAAALQMRRKTDPHLQPLFLCSVLNLNFMALIADYSATVMSPCCPSHSGHCAFQYLLH